MNRDDLVAGKLLALEVEAVNVLRVEPRQLVRLGVEHLEKVVRECCLPLVLSRAEDEGATDFEVRKGVGEEHVLVHDRHCILHHRPLLLRRRRDKLGLQGVVEASRRPKIRDPRCNADARSGEDRDRLAVGREDEARHGGEVVPPHFLRFCFFTEEHLHGFGLSLAVTSPTC